MSFKVLLASQAFQKIEGYSSDLKPFFQKYCIECHGPNKEKGGFRADQLPTVITKEVDAEAWQDLLDTLNIDEMPPEDEKQPSVEELSNVIEKITTNLYEAKKKMIDTSFITMAKLNKREYVNTINDLLGVTLDVDNLTDDGTLEGFDTIGLAHSLTDVDFETYLELGEQAITQALELKAPSKVSKSIELESRINPSVQGILKSRLKSLDAITKSVQENPDNTRFAAQKRSAEMYIRNNQAYLNHPASKSGFIIGLEQKSKYGTAYGIEIDPHLDPKAKRKNKDKLALGAGTYKAQIKVGLINTTPEEHAIFLETNLKKSERGTDNYTKLIDSHRVYGSPEQPHTIEMEFDYDGLRAETFNIQTSEINENIFGKRSKYKKGKVKPYVWIDAIHIEGPIKQKSTKAQEMLPANFDSIQTVEEAVSHFKSFAQHACRKRPPSSSFFSKLGSHFNTLKNDGMSSKEAMIKCFSIILASPNFLFKHEASAETDGNYRNINDLDFAIRLSYYLWSSPPDDELYRLATQNTLRKPEVLNAQLNRMLKDPKAMNLYESFMAQWLHLEELDMIVADSKLYPKFNETVRRHLKEETTHFFKEMVDSNLGVENFIASDFVMINDALADYYDIKTKPLNGFRAFPVSHDSHRGGLITQGSVLTMTSTGERTSPVLRGVFVYDKILGYPVPPPPPNVPQLTVEHQSSTVRESLDLHKTKAQCASCHSRIDPLGFALENFDAIGSWRDQVKLRKEGSKRSVMTDIDASGSMPGNKHAFENFQQFKAKLLQEKDRLASSVAKSMLTYSLGRRVGFSDGLFLNEFMKDWKENNYQMKDLIHLVVQSKVFNQK